MIINEKSFIKASSIPLFLILPSFFLFFSFLFKSEMGYYHLFGTDAEYAYLTNGLNLCLLHFPYHVQGPGTPLHVFSAINIEIVHLFRHNIPIVEDVMRNPDLYLGVIHGSITTIITLLLFVLGRTIFQISKNIFLSLFIQLIPFTSWQTLDLMRRYMLENLVIAGVIILVLILFLYLFQVDYDRKINKRFVWLFSLIIGFISATKLMYLPIAIVPFLVIPGFRNKGLFTLLSLIFFSIFAFAIFNHWTIFWDWHVKNFIHSGQYGSGKATIINFPMFKENLKILFTIDGTFRKFFLINIIGSILYHIPFFKVKKEADKQYYALVGIVITMIIMTFLVSKQLKYYYMITVILLEIPSLFLLIQIFTRPLKSIYKVIVLSIPVIYLVYNCYVETMVNYNVHDRNIQRRENYMEVYNYANTELKGLPTLLLPDYYGAPYREYGVFFGICWCGPTMGAFYAPTLDKLYPNVYIHHGWNNLFNQWDRAYSYIELLKKYKKVVLFVGDENLEKSLYSKLNGMNRMLDTRREEIKSFPKARASFYYVYLDSAKFEEPYTFFFDAEKRDSTGNFFLTKEGFIAQNGTTQSADFSLSGNYSCKLVKDNPYGMTCILSEVQKNDHYRISVWRYNNGNQKAGLVISGNNPDKYYRMINQTVDEKNGWEKIEFDFTVPESLVNEDVKIYLWNMDEYNPAYFDDLSIERK